MKNSTSFKTKFRLLDSQENTEEIIWSRSDSSDYENCSNNESKNNFTRRHEYRKRKRKTNKKAPKSTSNLDITITDVIPGNQIENIKKSPILVSKNPVNIDVYKNKNDSPTININERTSSSPILSCKNKQNVISCKSPILVPTSKLGSPNYRKKLFHDDLKGNTDSRSISPILTSRQSDKKTCIANYGNNQNIVKSEPLEEESSEKNNKSNCNLSLKHSELIAKVNSYFTSNLSSDSLSLSISEYETPKDSPKTSGEIEISEITQKLSLPIKKESLSSISSNMDVDSVEKNIKVKYKKDGLAYRLNDLLKKQNANVCLWQHERFLAANSNFIIPKGAFTMLRIRSVCNKFGTFLLNAINDKEEKLLILINQLYVKHKIESNVILKLYEPYRVLALNDEYKLIVNVCKFECLAL